MNREGRGDGSRPAGEASGAEDPGAEALKERGLDGSLGLALSGGAVLGCAHIGVLQALDEAGIRITHLAGTSAGALVAAFYAFGLSGKEIEKIAEVLRWPDVTRPFPSRLGFLSQEKLRKMLTDRLGDVRLEDAAIPLALVATDIATGEKVVITEGDLALAASASACFPGIFVPVEIDGRLLVDGGLVENLPVSPLRAWGVDRIIAVDVFLGMTFRRPGGLLDLIKNAVDIVLIQMSKEKKEEVDLLIAPDLHAFNSTELKDIPGLVKAGYGAAKEALARLGA
jgi:NTE family protein